METIDPEIQAKSKVKYPADEATGFKLGDLHGAFTVTQPL